MALQILVIGEAGKGRKKDVFMNHLKFDLIGRGYQADFLGGAQKALGLIREMNCFNLVVIRQNMKDMQGRDLAWRIKAVWPEIKIILISQNESDEAFKKSSDIDGVVLGFSLENVYDVIADIFGLERTVI